MLVQLFSMPNHVWASFNPAETNQALREGIASYSISRWARDYQWQGYATMRTGNYKQKVNITYYLN